MAPTAFGMNVAVSIGMLIHFVWKEELGAMTAKILAP
jgi:hypothetical protein